MPEPANVITLERVQKRFGEYVAVHEADFSIAHGEFFSMLGPSGCGKTTTLRMIAGFEQPTSGRLLLAGEDVSGVPANKRNVNTVFQHYALFPHMSVRQNVSYGLAVRRVGKAELTRRVDAILATVRLGELERRKPSQLSGGQQQRVALARALVNEPAALLLDEPLGALDLKLRQTMQFELKRIQQELGLAFVYVTHDQEEALTMSDRIAVMNLGRVEQIGTPTEIYDAPATVFVAGFIGQANLWPAEVIDNGAGVATTVRALGHTLEAAPNPAGPASTLMVRPERIMVTTDEGPRSVPVTVTHLVFQGPVLRLEGVAVDGSTVVAHIGPDADLALIRPGDQVYCSWPSTAARLVADGAQSAVGHPIPVPNDA